MTQYAPVYTSMECKEDQEYNDEPYAIFWGMDWREAQNIKTFVRRTKVYKYIDDGERGGANRGGDDKVLTKSGKWESIDRTKHFILVQAMEHDKGSPEYIVKALRRRLPLKIIGLILEKKSEDRIVEAAIEHMKEQIDKLRNLSRGQIKIYLQGGTAPLDEALISYINPDDRIGNPQVLPLRGDKQDLQFSSRDYGTYIYKFNIQSK